LSDAARAPAALYVHVPFCLSVCPYCDFVVYGGREAKGPTKRIGATVDALETEIRLRAPDHPISPLRSVYFGGGTPSLLSAAQIGRLLEAAEAAFGVAVDAEITLECNPGQADRGDLAGFRAAGVNRVSIGAQSMDAVELRNLGRRHSPEDVAETVAAARLAGINNVSIDLLYDIPGQTLDSWRATLAAAIRLALDHVSAYSLTLDDPDAEGLTDTTGDHLPLRAGARRWRQAAAARQDDAFAADAYALADDLLGAAGYGWYEISNWAQPGRASRHNLAYWTNEAWEAVGPGAHAFDGNRTRRCNAARLDAYLSALSLGKLPPGGHETLDAATAAAEAVILRMRTAAGLQAAEAPGSATAALAWGREHELIERTVDGSWRLTLGGRLLSNELFLRLLLDAMESAA
jgi:putative oxygen-independent coproporphyrinogen III oxidase